MPLKELNCHGKGDVVKKAGTRVMLVFGDPIAHSLSPVMQNAALKEAGINSVYGACRVPKDKIGEAVAAVRLFDIWGVNLTIPLKEVVLPYLDGLDEAARLIGAVNTIVNRDGKLTGYNTDVYGVSKTLEVDLSFNAAGKKVMLLGAGGASRAGIVSLCESGVKELGIANRNIERAKGLAAEFAKVFPQTSFKVYSMTPIELAKGLSGADLLINSTSVGLKGGRFVDFPWQALPAEAKVFDMVCTAEETPFVESAKRHGHMATGGLGMLAAQGEKAFELWTDVPPKEWLMRSVLNVAQGKPAVLSVDDSPLAGLFSAVGQK